MSALLWLDDKHPAFPPSHLALEEPNGLLAAGGNLKPETLVAAYRRGIFPWFEDGQPILWWSPSPRMCLAPKAAHLNRSLKKLARKQPFSIKVDSAFEQVMMHCADIDRPGQDGTWITDSMLSAYSKLHQQGLAHSVEAWRDGELVGGLYGLALGSVFFGESMFSRRSGASKLAFASLLIQLQRWNFKLIDCQVHTSYLASFGASELDRAEFEHKLALALSEEQNQNWQQHWSLGKHGFDGSE
ncbi:leucyl/phenylalanyl-tRNA--protein transferase [Agaribacterium haliotis]|uniref:leucyl/phenylalanyl-tRNA--protein transferase n=1 Tax=Agaribacterium haliotis TaxID=2013869 RepID=UPI000BB59130|nr:leucyl/phenylalanyl-tRNA--protein transferase [Agaribacterium haliotis]